MPRCMCDIAHAQFILAAMLFFHSFNSVDLKWSFLLALLLLNAMEMPHFIRPFLWKWNVYVCV